MYQPIAVPSFASNKTFSDFSKKEAEAYFDWFKGSIPIRLRVLGEAVRDEYPEFDLNYSRRSLSVLYVWFTQHVQYRPMTQSERAVIERQLDATPRLKQAITIDERVLDTDTVSICFDAGLLFAKTLQAEIPELDWTLILKPKSYVDVAQPVLVTENSKVPLNPRRITEVQAAKILDGHTDENAFITLLDIWKKMFLPKTISQQ